MIIYKRSGLVSIIILLLCLEFVFMDKIPYINYTDEIVGVISIIYIFPHAIYAIQSEKKFYNIAGLLVIVCLLGFIGNGVSKICPSFFAEAVDCLGVVKALVCFIFIYNYLDSTNACRVARTFRTISKIFLWCASFFGLISIFIDIGMSGEERYGLKAYSFVFEHAHMLAIAGMCALLIIALTTSRTRELYTYIVLMCLCQLLTTKGPSIIWTVIVFIMMRYYVNHKKIKIWLIVVFIIVGVALGEYQILNYILNNTAPRAILLKYGIVTANNYFPLGAGFATYGSEMSKVYYSKLYYEYGFNNIWGLTQDGGMFLNDNYWPMLIAQVGYIGAALFAFIYYMFFSRTQRLCEDRMIRAIYISNFIYIIIHSLGSAILTGMEGVLMFVIFGVTMAYYKNSTISEYEVRNENV